LEVPLPQPLDGESENRERVQTLRDDPTALEFQVDASGRGLLVVSEVFYPGWRASVNDRPEQVYRVDGFLRGVPVPSGRSTVRLEYRPRSVQAGFVATIAALIFTAFLGIWSSRHSLN
jgi:uncharacterized membrane protein YfhO